MSLFGDLSVGTSGLKVSQYSLNVVAHNLANVDTEGYVRQQAVLDTGVVKNIGGNDIATFQVGLGVDPQTVRQVRDFFLDKAYRTEIGRQGYYDSQADAVNEIEELFGEIHGVAFRDALSDLWVSMQEMAKEPDSRVAQATFIENGVTFLERADKIYTELKNYQHDLNTQISDQIKRINEIGKSLFDLNKAISRNEADGRENANDLRDQRNNLLDELGQMVKVDYRELETGVVVVDVEGVQFVNEDNYFKMGAVQMADYMALTGDDRPLDECADILMAVWPHLGNDPVFVFDPTPSSDANTDIGGLKGAIQARGTKIGKYTDIPIEPKREDYTDEDGVFDKDAYEEATHIYEADAVKYNLEIESSIVMRTQSQFDQLVHGIIQTINDCLCPNKEVELGADTTIALPNGSTKVLSAGTKIKIFDRENAPVGVDKDNTPATEFFKRKTVDRYMEPMSITLSDGTVIDNALIYNEEDVNDNYTMYTLGETEVNQALLSDKSKLPVLKPEKTGDYDIHMIQNLIEKWQEPFATLSPNTLTFNNFMGYYTSFTGSIATKGDEFHTLADNQRAMTESIQDKRTGITGVSSDEELTYLIRFQQAYNASARYINVIDQMLEHIIERLG
ncbi:MAG: flagellar hook-associated protein FlgK [Lachnospiraceae bacterium]|nr:flagellar hook-associated protein FlgK [Lachnospiraceae bacterium]